MATDLVLVLNCGSSSLKIAIIDPKTGEKYFVGLAECLYTTEPSAQWTFSDKKTTQSLPAKSAHLEAIDFFEGVIKTKQPALLAQLKGIGHRIVHGGEKYKNAIIIDESVIEGVKAAIPFAPLHNPAHLIGIAAAKTKFPQLWGNNVAVFDTAFYQTLPESAFLYAIPYAIYKQYGIRRYGAHGISHQYVSLETANALEKSSNDLNIITCHLGNGCSVTAIKAGQAVDTSMGLTPLEGLVMGTRCGDIDPAIIFYLHDQLGKSIAEINTLLTQKSGLLGLTGVSHDCRYSEDNYTNPAHPEAKIALDVFCHRLAKYIGAYSTLLDGQLDAITFTGGIGENSAFVRQLVLEKMKLFGIKLDDTANRAMFRGAQGIISSPESNIPVYVIPTNEELMIARGVASLISK